MKFDYCPTCGHKVNLKEAGDDGLVPYCEPCQRYLFDCSYSVIITAVVNQHQEVLLIKQPYIGDFYVLVAGYVIPGQDFETTCRREVQEEVNQVVKDLHYLRSFYFEKKDLTMIGFVSYVDQQEIKLSKEVTSAGWYSFDEALRLVRPGNIAHQVIADAKVLSQSHHHK